VPSPPAQAVKADRADRAAEPAVTRVRDEGIEVAPRPRWVPPLERLRSDVPEQPVTERTPEPPAPATTKTGDVDQSQAADLDAQLRVDVAASKAKAEAASKSRVAEVEDGRPQMKKRSDVCAQNGGWREDYRKGGHLYWRCRYKE
jgi:hypothetical protein